jgi:hypothetical protein
VVYGGSGGWAMSRSPENRRTIDTMALMRRKPTGRQEYSAPPNDDAEAEPAVQVTIEGPDAERLANLVDTSLLADLFRRRAAEPDPPAPS